MSAWLVRLTTEEAWIRGGPKLDEGSSPTVEIDGVGVVAARVSHIRPRGVALTIDPDDTQRRLIVAKLYTRAGRHGTLRLSVGGIMSGFVRRMIRASN